LQSRNRALAEAGVLLWETYPATSRVISRTNAVRLERKPFLREILGAGCLGVTSVRSISVRSGEGYSSAAMRGATYCGRR
jgi:predicted nuclease with RNAse H fold